MASIDRTPDLARELRAVRSRLSQTELGLHRVARLNNYPEWTDVTPSSPWSNVGVPGASGAEYYKDSTERVWLRGALLASSPGAGPSIAVVLPEGFRPPDLVVVPVWCDSVGGGQQVGRCAVTTSGQVVLSGYPSSPASPIVYLDAVNFRVR